MAANIFSVIGILLCLYLAILYQSTAACAVFCFWFFTAQPLFAALVSLRENKDGNSAGLCR